MESKEREEFVQYILEFYGEDGIYEDTFGEPLTEARVRHGVEKLLEMEGEPIEPNSDTDLEVAFDSLDRERVRDILLYEDGHRNTEHLLPNMEEHIRRPMCLVDKVWRDGTEETDMSHHTTEYLEKYVEIYEEHKDIMWFESVYAEKAKNILAERKQEVVVWVSGRGSAGDFAVPQTIQRAVCYAIESAIGRDYVGWSLTTEGAMRFLWDRIPDHFVAVRGGKALWTGREFLDQHDGGWKGT